MHPLAPLAAMIAILVAFMSAPAVAGEAIGTDSLAILAQQQDIRAKAAARKERYRDLEEPRIRELLANQDTVIRLLAGTARTTELPERDQIAVFNALEAIEAIVNQAEDERLVCERYKPVGSNRTQTMCKSVAQRRDEQEGVEGTRRRDQRCVDGWNSGFCDN